MDRGRRDPMAVQWTLTLLAIAALGAFIALPLIAVFVQAFDKGWAAYLEGLEVTYHTGVIKL